MEKRINFEKFVDSSKPTKLTNLDVKFYTIWFWLKDCTEQMERQIKLYLSKFITIFIFRGSSFSICQTIRTFWSKTVKYSPKFIWLVLNISKIIMQRSWIIWNTYGLQTSLRSSDPLKCPFSHSPHLSPLVLFVQLAHLAFDIGPSISCFFRSSIGILSIIYGS